MQVSEGSLIHFWRELAGWTARSQPKEQKSRARPRSRRGSLYPLISLVLVLGVYTSAGTRSSKAHASRSIDADYISALATVNRFLHAWQSRDHETAILLMTDTAKRNCSENRLETFLSSDFRAAYEIGRGRKLQPGRYVFPVTIFAAMPGNKHLSARPRYTEVVVARAGKNDWAVDRLPKNLVTDLHFPGGV